MNFCFLWAILEKCACRQPYTNIVCLAHWEIFPNFTRRVCVRKSSNFDPIFGKTNRIRPSPTLPRYVSQFSKLLLLNQQWHTRQLKRSLFTRTICFSKFYEAHTGHLSKRSDSWRPKGARHVWGRSVKCLGLIAGVSFCRLTPSPYCLFSHSLAVFLPFASVWKRKGNGCYAGYTRVNVNIRELCFLFTAAVSSISDKKEYYKYSN